MDIVKVTPSQPAPGKKKSKKARWQAYVDDALLRTGQVSQAAIFGLDGVEWAASQDLQVGSYDHHSPLGISKYTLLPAIPSSLPDKLTTECYRP